MSAEPAVFRRFAGRRAELGLLLEAFRRAKSEQRGAAFVIAGESGIGKSRLARECAAAAQRERCLVLHGTCLEYLATPYQAFADAFAADKNGEEIARALRRIEPGRVASAELERERRFKLVEDRLRLRSAVMGAVLLVVEDVQWSDAASLDLLRYLIRRLRDAPVLLIATCRSEAVALERPALTGTLVRDGAALLALEPLAAKDILALLRSALPSGSSLEPARLRAIGELSEGKPLLAEELLRGALDGSAPVTMRDAVLEALNAFAERGRELLGIAAVIGRSFELELLQRLSELPQPEILAVLRGARRRRLVVEESAGIFRFRHAITRDVLYGELLAAEVRVYHERIATALDAEGDARAGEAAYHWWAAGIGERATDANELAGDRASDMYATADAARSYERALGFAAGARRAQLIEKLAFALCSIGDMDAARRWCEEGADVLARLQERSRAQRLMLWVARQLYEAGDVDRALETVAAVRAELLTLEPSQIHCTAETTFAGMLATLGRAREALAVLDAIEAAPCERDPSDGFRYHNARGNALCQLGAYADASECYGRALGMAGISDELRLFARLNAGDALLLVGDLPRAAESYGAANELARGRGFRRHQAMISSGLAFVALYRGDLSSALRHYVEVVESESAVPMNVVFAHAVAIRLSGLLAEVPELAELDPDAVVEAAFRLRESQTTAVVCGAASWLALVSGRDETARQLAARGLAAVSAPNHAYLLCDVAAAVGDDAAVAKARRLLALAAGAGVNRAATAHAVLFDARLALASEPERAARLARDAAASFDALGMPLESATAFEAAGDVRAAAARYAACGARLAQARVTANGTPGAAARDRRKLTAREAEVAGLAARGYTSREIAGELEIGERTVETHIGTVYRKLGVRTRVELAARVRSGT